MKYLLYKLKDNTIFNNLIYDDLLKIIKWEKNDDYAYSRFPPLEKLYRGLLTGDIVIDKKNLDFLEINNSKKIDIKNITLFMNKEILGEFEYIDEKTFQTLIIFGGIILRTNTNKIIFTIVNNFKSNAVKVTNSVRSSIVNKTLFEEENKQVNDYYEATIKIPKIVDGKEVNEKINRIFDSNKEIYKKIIEIDRKIENNNQNMSTFNKENETLKIQIENLLMERNILKEEIENANLIAKNIFIKELDTSKIAIMRHPDLDKTISIKEEITKILNMPESEERNNLLVQLSDNIDSKIDSLKEIKKNFEDNNIIKVGN